MKRFWFTKRKNQFASLKPIGGIPHRDSEMKPWICFASDLLLLVLLAMLIGAVLGFTITSIASRGCS